MTEKQSAHNGLVGGSSPSGPTTIFSGADSALAVGQSPDVGAEEPTTQRLPQGYDPTEGRDPLLPWSVEDNGFHYLIVDGDGGEVAKVNNRNDAALIVHMVNGWVAP